MLRKSLPLFCYSLIATLGFTMLSCGDDSDSKNMLDGDHIVVVQSAASAPAPTQVSLVELSTGTVTKLADCDGRGGQTVRSGNDLFIISHSNANSGTYVLNKFNLSTRTMERVADSEKETIPFSASPLAVHNDKLYFSGRDNNGWYICKVDNATFAVEDTIHVNNDLYGINSLKFFGEQLFVNLGDQVKVYANGSHKPSAVLKLDAVSGFDFMEDRSDRLVLPGVKSVVAIDPRNLSIDELTQNVKVPPFFIAPTLAKDDNILYAVFNFYLGIDPPGVHLTTKPLRFGKIDLTTGETIWSSETDDINVMFQPEIIRYGKIQNRLIVAGWTRPGGASGLQVLGIDGRLIKDIPLDGIPIDVIMD